MAIATLLIFFTIISYFSKLATTSSSEDLGIATLCMGNSTRGIDLYQNYQYSVSQLLSKLSSEYSDANPQLPFFNTTAGEVPDKVYGSYLCRGGLSSRLCRECISKVTQQLSSQDFYYECFGFGVFEPFDHCIVRYANHSIGYKEGSVLSPSGLGAKVTNYQQYNQTLSTTVERLVREADFGNWSKPDFETRVVGVDESSEKIYVLVQCTPDISPRNCSKCLGELYSELPKCCNGTQGGQVIHANCLMMYNNQSFFGSSDRAFIPNYLHFCFVVILYLCFLHM